jgi:tetratricopeptide (TPR) repeat protein
VKGENGRLQRFCIALRFFLEFSGRWDELQRLFLQAEAAALAVNDFRSAGWRAYTVGYLNGLRGQSVEVMLAADRATAHWGKIDVGPLERSKASRLRGIGYWIERNREAALDAYRKALDFVREDDSQRDEIPFILNDMANVELDHRNYDEAKERYCEALRIWAKTKNREGIAIYTGNLANLELTRENWHLAEKLARKALTRAERVPREELIGSACCAIAQSLARQDRRAEGLPYAKRADEIFTRLGQTRKLADVQAVLKECQQ